MTDNIGCHVGLCSALRINDCTTTRKNQVPTSPNSNVSPLPCKCSPESDLDISLPPLTEVNYQEKDYYFDLDTNSLQHLSVLQGLNITASKEHSESVILEVSLPPAESQTGVDIHLCRSGTGTQLFP